MRPPIPRHWRPLQGAPCCSVVVVTDGQENSSREFQKGQVAKMVKEKQEKAGWQFVFLSADTAAIGAAVEVGIQGASAMAFAGTAGDHGMRAVPMALDRHHTRAAKDWQSRRRALSCCLRYQSATPAVRPHQARAKAGSHARNLCCLRDQMP